MTAECGGDEDTLVVLNATLNQFLYDVNGSSNAPAPAPSSVIMEALSDPADKRGSEPGRSEGHKRRDDARGDAKHCELTWSPQARRSNVDESTPEIYPESGSDSGPGGEGTDNVPWSQTPDSTSHGWLKMSDACAQPYQPAGAAVTNGLAHGGDVARSPYPQSGGEAANPSMWSVGSETHGQGLCRPCAHCWKPGGCFKGDHCEYCHLCGQHEFQQHMLQRKKARRRRRQLSEVPEPGS
eukprot:TRINITY_DN30470_c0_g1_i1.p1 TRINITY_DN30470_c0_g1~~TRINITY_DN30470_c0_g1_i1.p1  ORF type:complete len:274 (+),score=37.55 TRINITY_DN30470_c0_g1_i1:106-822(+)